MKCFVLQYYSKNKRNTTVWRWTHYLYSYQEIQTKKVVLIKELIVLHYLSKPFENVLKKKTQQKTTTTTTTATI